MTATVKEADAYSQAVASGKYDRENELRDKYDNVRVFWEDEVTRSFLRPHVEGLVQRRRAENRGIRILDLGCGSGDGYELLMDMTQSEAGLNGKEIRVIPEDHLDHYQGVELNEDLLGQNAERWGENPKMDCTWGDFSQGLPIKEGEPPFDIYLTSYGALSHLDEDQTVRLFADIARHAEDGSLIVGDWLGKYSYEWQQLWSADPFREQWMNYLISYIYSPEERDEQELASLDLRLLSRGEVARIVKRAEGETGIRLAPREIFDRSIFVGRHMDTGDYNPHLKSTPLRNTVNSLFERNLRTELEQLLIEYHPHPDIAFPDAFFEQFQSCWNALVHYTMALCSAYDSQNGTKEELPTETGHPVALKESMEGMRQAVEGVDYFQADNPRADLIEPQLGYALRNLEMSLQRGAGHGHGIASIFAVEKP